MRPVKRLRLGAGLTQQALANRAGTSQATIAAYESGAKSPTLRTLDAVAASVGRDVAVDFVPRMNREDHRSLAYHRAVASRLGRHDGPMRERARRSLRRLRALHPHAAGLLRQWSAWLELPTVELIARIEDPGVFARDMRQVSPFAGQLDAAERARVLRAFRSECAP